MREWSVRLVLLAVLAGLLAAGWGMLRRERDCVWTNRCEQRLRGLGVQLEFYASDRVIAVEKKLGHPSERRAFYPDALDELVAKKLAGPDELRCPVYGVPYAYLPRDGGRSYLLYCPARHRFHFSARPFVLAVTPEAIGLHLVVDGGQVFNMTDSHDNPWDFQGVRGKRMPDHLPASLIHMLGSNPAPLVHW